MARMAWLILCAAAAVSTMSGTGIAQPAISVIVDGQTLRLDPPPLVVGGHLLVPLRGVSEALGARVQWKRLTRTIVIVGSGSYVSLRVGDRTASVGGTAVPLEVPARAVGGRVYVPLRFVGEAFSARVEWRAADRTVVISTVRPPSATRGRTGEIQVITIPRTASSPPASDLGESVTIEPGKVAVRLARAGVRVGAIVVVTVANGLDQTIYSDDFNTACSIVTLERQTGAGWDPLTGCALGRPTMIVAIGSGRGRTISLDPRSIHLRKAAGAAALAFGAGTYRVVFSYRFTPPPSTEQTVRSATFVIR